MLLGWIGSGGISVHSTLNDYVNILKKPHRPNPLNTGIVTLSSQPKISTTSLALATNPLHKPTTPSATHPPIVPWPSFHPTASLITLGKASSPLNMNSSSNPQYLGTTHPQNKPAVNTPTTAAAALPARLFPFLILGVYLPYILPIVLAAVSHQLNSNTAITPTSLGRNRSTAHAPRRYHITPLYFSLTSLSRMRAPKHLM